MNANHGVAYFDRQFQQPVREQDFGLNPFELAALQYPKGRVPDDGCGMGNLALEAARRGYRSEGCP